MGFAIVVSVALLADLTHADRRGAAIGSYGLALSLPSIFVPSLGVYLLSFGRSDLDALIATVAVARRLEDELFTVGREIRLGVFTAERQLLQVPQMFFVRQCERVSGLLNGR